MSSTRIDLTQIGTRDALDLAVLIEEEAKDRYLEFAEQMAAHRNDDAQRFFSFMADNEEKHREALAARRYDEFGTEPVRVSRGMIFDVEAPGYEQARMFQTVRQALETALRSEVKAYDFFSRALTQVTDARARALFTELCAEEAQHQRLVEEQLARLPPEPALGAEDYADDPVSVD